MQECELAVSISAIACGLAKCMSEEELVLLGASLTQLGDTLATIVARRDYCKNIRENCEEKFDDC